MPKAFLQIKDEAVLDAVDPADGPWTVEIYCRMFWYAPFPIEHDFGSGGHAYASAGDVITLVNREDYVRGLKHGCFVDESRSVDPTMGEGPGDFGARPDLVEFVKNNKVDDVLAHANGDAELAQLLIDAENEAKPHAGEPRKGVISGLQAIIDEYLDPDTPASTTEGMTAGDADTGDAGSVPDPGDGNEDGPETENNSEEE